MGRAFLSARYTDNVQPAMPVPVPVDNSIRRWDQEEFDPDSEDLGGHAMVYEAFMPPAAQQDVIPDAQDREPSDELPARVQRSRTFLDTESSSSSESDSDSNSTVQSEQTTEREATPPPDIDHRRTAPQSTGPNPIASRVETPTSRAAMLLEIIARDRRRRIASSHHPFLPAEVSQSA